MRTQKAWEHYDTGTLCCSSAYRKGWKAGYYDVLTGNCGTPPLFAPEGLSCPLNITWHCDEPRHDWYVGFQDGAACAHRQPDTHYLKPWLPPCNAPVDECPIQDAPYTSSLMLGTDAEFVEPGELPESFVLPEQPTQMSPKAVPPAIDESTEPELAPGSLEDLRPGPQATPAPMPPSLDLSPEALKPAEQGAQSAVFRDRSSQVSALPEPKKQSPHRIQPVSETRPAVRSTVPAVQSPLVIPAHTPEILNQDKQDIIQQVTTA
ncbi:MAG: hypothetical protein R3C59_02225 [Planctomycetaceae bacterium]